MNKVEIAITGIGVISPYGVGFDKLEAGLLAGRCCLEPSTGFYPGFQGTVAQVHDLELLFRNGATEPVAPGVAPDSDLEEGRSGPAPLSRNGATEPVAPGVAPDSGPEEGRSGPAPLFRNGATEPVAPGVAPDSGPEEGRSGPAPLFRNGATEPVAPGVAPDSGPEEGRSGPAPLPDIPHFRPSRTDRLAMLAARDALTSAGIADHSESGIVMASTVAGLTEIEPQDIEDPAAWYRRGGLAKAASYPVAHVADAVGEYLGMRGPRCALTVACASGAASIALAANMLRDGVVAVALAGGSDALCPFTLSGFSSLQALDAGPCRPFDKERAGLNLGEGAAVLVLETLEGAAARGAPILAILRGWAMTNDAFHPTAPHSEGRGLAACMVAAMKMAGVTPDEIGYVNAHGTGTPLNDAAETKAYESAFGARSQPIPVSSTKSYFGHCLGAAGALEAAITICGIRRGALFPTLRLSDPINSPAVDWLMGAPRFEPLPLAMTVSAGFGGSNAALIFGRGSV